MEELENLENKLKIVKKIFTGHSHKELNLDTIYRVMGEMDSAFIEAYHAGAEPKDLDPLNREYIRILYDYLKKH